VTGRDQSSDWIWDEGVRAALRESTKQEGHFDDYFLTRVLSRLHGTGYRVTPLSDDASTCPRCTRTLAEAKRMGSPCDPPSWCGVYGAADASPTPPTS
jgi:hypothetical protein